MGLGAAGTAAVVAGGIGAAGSIGGAMISSSGQQQAAQTQQQALSTEQAMAAPYTGYGQMAGTELVNELSSGQLGQMPDPTNAQLANMPGYQFTLNQGLMATQNAAAAQGLGVSGNALAAAGQYATNLAATNYQNYFSDYWANQNNRYNMLAGIMQTGANAAVGAGSNVANTSTGIANAQANAATAQAAGLTGASNATMQTLNNPLVANALFGSGSTVGGGSNTPLTSSQFTPTSSPGLY